MIITFPVYFFFAVMSVLFPSYGVREVVEPEVVDLVAEFKKDCISYGLPCTHVTDIPIFWQQLSSPNVGYCWYAGLDFRIVPVITLPVRVIVIDPNWWKTADAFMRRNLIYHELGHCELNVDHTTNPSIMYPNILSSTYIVDNWPCLVDQLFRSVSGMCFDNKLYEIHNK